MPSRYFIINRVGEFYRHKPGFFVSWGPLSHANEFQTVQSARYISDKHLGSRVVEMKGKRIVEVD